MAITTDYQIEVGGLTMGAGTAYKIDNITGLGVPESTNQDRPRSVSHGSFLGADWMPGRNLGVSLRVIGSSPAQASQLVDDLKEVWYNHSSVQTMRIRLPGWTGNVRRVYGRPRRAAIDIQDLKFNSATAELEFFASDPRLYADNATQSTVALPTGSGNGLTFNVTFNATFGAALTGGSILITNNGNFPTLPTITILGPVTNPSLQLVETGEKVKFDLTLGSSDSLVIDFDRNTATLNGTASRSNAITNDSVWWQIPPGSWTVKYTADTNNTAATATVRWYDAYI